MDETLSFHAQRPGPDGVPISIAEYTVRWVPLITTIWEPILHQNNTARSRLSSRNGLSFIRNGGGSFQGQLTEVFPLKN
jgi:hypothetical protein